MTRAVYAILIAVIAVSIIPNSFGEEEPILSFTGISSTELDKILFFSGERFGDRYDIIITVSDPEEKTIHSMKIRTTEDGKINLLVPLGKNPIEGQYEIIVHNRILALTYNFSYENNKVIFLNSSIDYFDNKTITENSTSTENSATDIGEFNGTIQLSNSNEMFTIEFSENDESILEDSTTIDLEQQIELLQSQFSQLQDDLIGSFVSVQEHKEDIEKIHEMVENINTKYSTRNVGTSCWDANNDGMPNQNEDVNGDGKIDSQDCQGMRGPQGSSGISCWDLDADGLKDSGEDLNGDSIVDVMDCKGIRGDSGIGLSCENQIAIKNVVTEFKLSNGCKEQKIVINEIVYDTPGSDLPDAFTELYGIPGMNLDDYQLVAIDLEQNKEYRSEKLSGIIPSDGFFVIGTKWSKGNVLANRDHVAQVNWKDGPNAIILKSPDGQIVDALQYGDHFRILGEGMPAKDVKQSSGHSLTRDYMHTDSDMNSSDFRESMNPTPGF